jgi:hypothetical protein
MQSAKAHNFKFYWKSKSPQFDENMGNYLRSQERRHGRDTLNFLRNAKYAPLLERVQLDEQDVHWEPRLAAQGKCSKDIHMSL